MAPPTPMLPLDVEAISGICGSISIACWVVVFSPQIIQQFRQGNADGLSIQFVIIWLVGDVFNVLGSVLQGVLPTMIILAVYYTLADIVLLAQSIYYRSLGRRRRKGHPSPAQATVADENTRLLAAAAPSPGADGTASDWAGLSPAVPRVSETADQGPPPTALQTVVWNATAVVTVCAAGVLGWYLGVEASRRRHHGDGSRPPASAPSQPEFHFWGQVFGYLCAVAYIASRMPQLILNWRRKTTDGLSMLFFLFACIGNVTYILSVLAYEPSCGERGCEPGERGRIYGRYVLINLSWILGSFLTLFLDLAVFGQYFYYREASGGIASEQSRYGGQNRDGGGRGSEADDGDDDGDGDDDDDDEYGAGRADGRIHRPLLRRGDSSYQ